MPYVDLISQDDYASLWYTTNSATKHASSFDPEKPTVMMLHALGFDSIWLSGSLSDPRLYDNYNIIAIDSRYAGKSWSRPTGKLDHWVEAADLAFICQVRRGKSAECWRAILIITWAVDPPATTSTCLGRRASVHQCGPPFRHLVRAAFSFHPSLHAQQSSFVIARPYA